MNKINEEMTLEERVAEKMDAWDQLNPAPCGGERIEALRLCKEEALLDIEEGLPGETAEKILQQ